MHRLNWRRAISLSAVIASLLSTLLFTASLAKADNPPRKIFSGWIPYYSTKNGLASALTNADLISEVTPFWYTLKDPQTIQDNYTPANPSIPISSTISQLQQAGFLLLPTITDGTAIDPKTGKYVQLTLSNYLANPTTENQIISTITNLVSTNKFDGIDLDWENFAFVDSNSTWPTTQSRWAVFIKDLSTSLHAQGKLLSITTPPLFDPASGKRGYYFYAWQQVGSYIDRLRIMAYDYSTSAPGPIGPITWTESAVKYAISVMPASKVFIGIPGYGRDWVTKVDGTCPSLPINYLKTVSPSASAATFLMRDANNLAATYGATPTYNEKFGESTFTYQKVYNGTTTDGTLTTCTATRTAWFQDAQGFALRAALVAKYHLGGIAEWTVGMEDPTAIAAIRQVALSIAPDPVIANLSANMVGAHFGDTINISATLTKRDSTPLAGLTAQIEMKTASTDWAKIYTASTGVDGSLSIPVTLGEGSAFRVRADGSWDRLPAQSPESHIDVQRIISWNPPTNVKRGTTFLVSGSVQPKVAGVKLHLDSQGSRTLEGQLDTVTDSNGKYSFSLSVSNPGGYLLRVVADGDNQFTTSQTNFVTVLVR